MAKMEERESWESYERFIASGSLDRYTKLLARYELFKMVVDLPGDIVECGVLKGDGILFWARLIQIFNPLSRRRVIGFDTFEGYRESSENKQDREAVESFLKKTNYQGYSENQIMAKAESLNLGHRIQLIKGDANRSIRDYVQKNHGCRIALLNLDFDVYRPTLAALENLYPLVVPQGVIVFDEYGVHEWGESSAVDSYFGDRGGTFKSFPWSFSPTAYLVKGK